MGRRPDQARDRLHGLRNLYREQGSLTEKVGSVMALIAQQDIVVVKGPYDVRPGQDFEDAAAEKLKSLLDEYPPCRIVSLVYAGGQMHGLRLIAIVETV